MLHIFWLVLFVWIAWNLAPLLFWAVLAPVLYVGSLFLRLTRPR